MSELARWTSGLVDGSRGVAVHEKGDRTVWRVEHDGVVAYAKGGTGSGAAAIGMEAHVHAELQEAGLPVVPLLASGEADGRTWIVTGAARGTSLDRALRGASDRRERSRLLGLVGAAIRRFQEAGCRWPDLTSPHVHVDAATGSVAFLDLARAERTSGVPPLRGRCSDLAALLCSLPLDVADRGARVRLLRGALGGADVDLRAAVEAVRRRGRKLLLRTRWRHAHVEASDALRAAVGGLDGPELFRRLLGGDGMVVQRTLPDRENRRFGGPDDADWFMKLYPPVRQGRSPAMHERAALDLFARSGIPVCRLAAYGEDVDEGSFVVLRACAGEPLDDLVRRGVTPAERRVLATELGRIFGRMRARGLRHRDAYACHVFAHRLHDPGQPPRFELRMIDLTRAGPAPFPKERWFVKDVAQLWHGLPRPPVSRSDAVRFLRAYFGITRLDRDAKRFARRAGSKEARISRRQERKRAERGS